MYGVRPSFALNDWQRLAEAFPPAKEAVLKARDTAQESVFDPQSYGRGRAKPFHDLVRLNEALGEGVATVRVFKALRKEHPKLAEDNYRAAEATLIRAKEYEICAEYVDPSYAESIIEMYRRQVKRAESGRFGDEYLDYAKNNFINDSSTLLALLVMGDRKVEADQIAERFKAQWDDADFHAAIDSALTGVVPEPWP